MVFTRPVQRGWSRRAVLGMFGTGMAAGIAPAAGCSWWDSDPPPPPAPPDPLEPLLASTRDLAGRYAQTIAGYPELAGRLGPLHEAHLAHEAALLAVIGRPELAATSPGTPSGTAQSAAGPSASSPQEAVAALRKGERDGREQAAQACLAAEPGRAALLGSITAARRTHLEVLA